MAQNPISDDQAGHQSTLVNGTIVMPTDDAYERARQAERYAPALAGCKGMKICKALSRQKASEGFLP
ncbi:hypothetical protein ACS33_00865 [Edwardsiella ictaluri]|nr:hypothetical protein ABY58_00865 [Edwardsiella ictaluri]KOO56377.1 hypothetical protein ACS33_00865 [Edwardsiella ictaluri]